MEGRTDRTDRETDGQAARERQRGQAVQRDRQRKIDRGKKREKASDFCPQGPVAEREQERQHKKRTDEGRKRKDEESR